MNINNRQLQKCQSSLSRSLASVPANQRAADFSTERSGSPRTCAPQGFGGARHCQMTGRPRFLCAPDRNSPRAFYVARLPAMNDREGRRLHRRLERFYIDVPGVRPGTPGSYGLALVLAAVATALRLAIDPYVQGIQHITYFPAVIATTFVSGFRAGASASCFASCALFSSCFRPDSYSRLPAANRSSLWFCLPSWR